MIKPVLFELSIVQRWIEDDQGEALDLIRRWVSRDGAQCAIVGELPTADESEGYDLPLQYDDEQLRYLRLMMQISGIKVAHVCNERMMFVVGTEGITQAWSYTSAPTSFDDVPAEKPWLVINRGAPLGLMTLPIADLQHDQILPDEFLKYARKNA